MSDRRLAKPKLNKEGARAKGGKSESGEFVGKNSGKRRGLGFQEVTRNDSKIVRKNIQKRHLVSQNGKPVKKGSKKSRGGDDDDDEPLKVPEDFYDDEPSKSDMFKSKKEKKTK